MNFTDSIRTSYVFELRSAMVHNNTIFRYKIKQQKKIENKSILTSLININFAYFNLSCIGMLLAYIINTFLLTSYICIVCCRLISEKLNELKKNTLRWQHNEILE